MIVSAESLSIPATERDGTWPHEAGTLQLNPMYRATRRPDGGLRLSLEYPSVWFALENAGAMAYLPFEADVSPDAIAALRSGQRTSEIEALIATFVLLGLPPGYTHDCIRTSEGMRGGGRATG